jgi:hypothetical protein
MRRWGPEAYPFALPGSSSGLGLPPPSARLSQLELCWQMGDPGASGDRGFSGMVASCASCLSQIQGLNQ